MIKRFFESEITGELGKGKAIIILGARQVGKTTLLNDLFADKEQALFLNGDEADVQALFENSSSTD